MVFRFVNDNPGGDHGTLTAAPVILRKGSDRAAPAVAVRISGGPRSSLLYVPLDRVEELLTGIKAAARQAAADFHQNK